MRKASFLALIWVLIAAVLPARALEVPLPMDEAFVPVIAKEDDGRLTISWKIADGYYLYRDYLSAEGADDQALILQTEPGKIKDDPGFGTTEVYYGEASASIADAPQTIRLTYQGCQDGGLCYPPTTRTIDVAAMTISKSDGGGFALPPTGDARPAADAGEAKADFAIAGDSGETTVDRLLTGGGLALLLAGFLGFGLLLAFTPCVFPIYPIVAAMLTREGEGLTAGRGFVLASAYVLALAAAFGLVGIAAAWSGQNLQIVLQSPLAIGAVAGLFVLLALSNFGLFHIQLPAAIGNRLNGGRRKGGSVGAAALLGLSSAFLIGPCVTAPLAGALLYIARTGDVVVGALALFALGLGKGIPLIAMATIGGKALPRAGAWMENVRHVFGFLFLGTAIWLATPLVPERFVLLPWAVLALAFGVYAGAFDGLRTTCGLGVLARSAAVVSLLWGSLLLAGFGLGASDPLTPLGPLKRAVNVSHTIEKADFTKIGSADRLSSLLGTAAADNRPTLVYVTADWCVTCRTIERSVLTAPDVAASLDGIRLASLDVTTLDADNSALMRSLAVVGPPTMIFFDGSKQEVHGTRLVGDITATSFSDAARIAKGSVQ
ncbi:thiol:disulfide interchange protein DsbD [Mycoplana sp. BE70]|uniref:protein-disulfide reductase DsbD n=1 Tax=Mycoplana sp. BE70 TaxID=2817775 RepID=UPI002863EC6B|nr:protein-disulfide reductase DsbD [Mycoplana sp. BE70]MDR6759181.1 thiol:disulfide interchange protein DsbD [Mycoplana sp. BE70]